jgi:hypothetical protein
MPHELLAPALLQVSILLAGAVLVGMLARGHVLVEDVPGTGKTSLVRTLLRSGDFGQVADRGGTTRQVTSSSLTAADEVLVELFDSPGLENAPELIDTLELLSGQRHDGPERIAMLLTQEQGKPLALLTRPQR